MSDEKKPGKSAIRYVVLLLIVAAAVLFTTRIQRETMAVQETLSDFTRIPSFVF
ncbi:MAG: hypothetical protein IKG93_02300 [Clostridiales bacterium]|nr:hypothetical protein [Clostridiales bacterium]